MAEGVFQIDRMRKSLFHRLQRGKALYYTMPGNYPADDRLSGCHVLLSVIDGKNKQFELASQLSHGRVRNYGQLREQGF